MNDNSKKSRRSFLKKAAVVTGATIAAPGMANAMSPKRRKKKKASDAVKPFNLKYAPHPGMFKHHAGDSMLDQIKFCHDMGFRAWFDNGIMKRPVAEQEAIANQLEKLGMDLGPFVLYADFSKRSFVLDDDSVRNMLTDIMQKGMETAKRVNAKWALVVPGRYDEKLHWDYQTTNVINNLKMCAGIVEQSGLVLVLEPLNALQNHPGLFLTGIPQSYMVCKSVNSPACKIVNDFYHQQITEGNLIPNMEQAWSEIAAFHIGDNPGRKEPLTGEINYRNVFKHVHKRGYDGVLCMEHGKSLGGIEGEKKLIEAYRFCDDFLPKTEE
ncbi:twin-arginine translocation signal domain-containing protein [Prolixibacteraceae bacterium JC049]|nr:twin-arginine translocation signal domain-containing protein [Prolixibacteraceae bacterium JC049]